MKSTKAQMQNPGAFFVTLVVSGILAAVGLLIYSQVSNTSSDLFATENKYITDESVTISATTTADDNSTLLAQAGFLTNSEIVTNKTSGYQLVRDVDYKITFQVGSSGSLDARANFTLLNLTGNVSGATSTDIRGFNNSELLINYSYTDKDASRKLKETEIDTTTLDAFNLAVVGLIVLAAIMILTFVYWIGSK